MIAFTQTPFSAWLYEHSLTGLAVAVVTAMAVGGLYWLTKRGVRPVTVAGILTVVGVAGFFLMAADTFLSAASGAAGAAALLVLADLLLSNRKCGSTNHNKE